jgi:hypothetical protein
MIVRLTVYNRDTMEIVSKQYMEDSEANAWERAHLFSDGMPIESLTTDRIPASAEQVEAFLYLQATDYHVLKYAELGEDIPAGITTKRNSARSILDNG